MKQISVLRAADNPGDRLIDRKEEAR